MRMVDYSMIDSPQIAAYGVYILQLQAVAP